MFGTSVLLTSALILQVDLFKATGKLPRNLDEVLERQKDIQDRAREILRLSASRNWVTSALRCADCSDIAGRIQGIIPTRRS